MYRCDYQNISYIIILQINCDITIHKNIIVAAHTLPNQKKLNRIQHIFLNFQELLIFKLDSIAVAQSHQQ